MLAIYAGLLYGTGVIAQRIPSGFIPIQDQGYLITVVQLPDGASLGRTDDVVRRASQIIMETPGVANAVAIGGLSGATFTNASNAAVLFAPLKPFKDRLHDGLSSDTISADLFKRMQGIQEAFIIVIPPPPVRGLGNAGGFKMQVQDRGGVGLTELLAVTRDLIGQANQNPNLTRVFTTFGANTPQIYLEIDRTKARMLNVPLPNIFNTLQVNLGSAYINDFNVFGRVYQVRAQAEQNFRIEREDVLRLKVRSSTGALVPLGSLVEVRDIAGPDLVQHYNMYTSIPVQGDAAPGVSTGTALLAMEQLAQAFPPGLGFEWTELAYQERNVGNTAVYIFGLAVLFVFLVLAAQYESWALPLAIILIVPMSVLAALIGVMLRGQDNNILTQIGLVVLVGLAAKNAILIVEFAKQAEEEGKGPVEAVVEACRLRLRPILMTAFAFILGVVPLVTATGPGAEMRRALGTAVFSGMIGVTLFGLFLTPVFYVAIRAVVGALSRWRGGTERPAPDAAPAE
jgi:HAE1 family hydrophobic/amphiphilic exporter-1